MTYSASNIGVTLKCGLGSFKVTKMAPTDKRYTTYYWSVIVTIALSCAVFELLYVE